MSHESKEMVTVNKSALVLLLLCSCLPDRPDLQSIESPVTQSQLMTSVVPISPPVVTGSVVQSFQTVSGLGSSTRPLVAGLPTTVGGIILGIRVRVTDGSPGPFGITTLHAQFVSTADNSETFTLLATSGNSDGTGAEQTLTLPIFQPIGRAQQFYALVSPATGGGNGQIWRLEMDYSVPLPSIATTPAP